jgi:hypothetical protein
MNELIQQLLNLLNSQKSPPPDLLRRIHEQGQENTEYLIQALQQRNEETLEIVILLLGSLNARQVIPDLRDILRNRKVVSNIHTAIATALYDMQALDELLDVIQDEQASIIGRYECVRATKYLTVGSPEMYDRVCQTLHDCLAGILERAPEITADEILLGEELIYALVALNDRKADILLDDAYFNSGIVAWFLLSQELVGPPQEIMKPPDWLVQYEEEYQSMGRFPFQTGSS